MSQSINYKMKRYVLNVVFNCSFQKIDHSSDAAVEGIDRLLFGRVRSKVWRVKGWFVEGWNVCKQSDLYQTITRRLEALDLVQRKKILDNEDPIRPNKYSCYSATFVVRFHNLLVCYPTCYQGGSDVSFFVKIICCFASPTKIQFMPKYEISCLPFYLPVHCYLYIIRVQVKMNLQRHMSLPRAIPSTK
jgi:hypothetical protein